MKFEMSFPGNNTSLPYREHIQIFSHCADQFQELLFIYFTKFSFYL
jgi:hypothetical protein